LAQALLRAADRVDEHPVTAIVSTAGGGLSGTIDGVQYCIGNYDFIRLKAKVDTPAGWLASIASEAVTAVFLTRADEALAMFTFVDEMREDALATVVSLRALGKSVLLMTGDRAPAARLVAAQTGIADWRAQMSPQQKMEAVQLLQAAGAKVLMVGDGINDAPVLAVADVSVAMAGASSLARVNADIVLMRDRLEGVDYLFGVAARTRKIIRQNMSWALLYNFSAIPAAAMGLVAPWFAALGMSLSSLLVVINAMRLTR
jgi:Cu2+-exporting ATPase